MSVVSSRVSSIASILKGSGVRSTLLNQQKKLRFKLPSDLKTTLLNYESNIDRQTYLDLVCILRDSTIKDDDLLKLLNDVRDNILLLGSVHKLLIEALLNLKWTCRSESIVVAFKQFVEDLTCMHSHYCKFIINILVKQLKVPEEGAAEWENGKCSKEDLAKFNHIHDILLRYITIIPMISELLLQTLVASFPHLSEGIHTTERYVFALFQVTLYAPQLRKDILSLIINRLITLDVSAPPSEIQYHEEEGMDEDEEMFAIDDSAATNSKNTKCKGMKLPAAQILDVCMEQMFEYVHNSCFVDGNLNIDSLRIIYNDLLSAFERIILPTYASHHVQFIMYYLCSFKGAVVETFVKWLWQKVSNPNVAPIIRQSAVSYVSSLLARAPFVPLRLLQDVLSDMSTWIHSYINSQDSLECANSDIRVHTVFYSVCQAMFYLLAFRHKDIVDGKRNLLFLEGLNLTKIVTCRLNPLKVCQPAVVQNFAAVTRKYQLAYCYTVIDRNSRDTLPIIHSSHRFTKFLDTFFPFDPYILHRSGQRINSIYNSSQSLSVTAEVVPLKKSNAELECDDDDFMDESFSECLNIRNKFSYSTSPGFLQT